MVVRADLPPGLQLAQAVHAQREFVREHHDVEERWYRVSNTLAILSVKHEDMLRELHARARVSGVPVSMFHEPDLSNAATALCMAPGEVSRRLCRKLPLALKI